jgi:hypothetical protein
MLIHNYIPCLNQFLMLLRLDGRSQAFTHKTGRTTIG